MAVVSSREAAAGLVKKGFHRREAAKHLWFDLVVDGKLVGISTHISRGKNTHSEIGNTLLGSMRKELCLNTNAQAYDLLKCPMSREQYLAILDSASRLDPPKAL
jgi:hypothetical protein